MKRAGLLLPGYACTSDIWRPVIAELAGEFELEAVDWPTDLTPEFHAVDHFALWLGEHYWPRACDFVIGHSMGGLVALRLSLTAKINIANIILVESFLTEPGPFFRNTLMPDAPVEVKSAVAAMIDHQEQFYSPVLRDRVRSPEVTLDMFPVDGAIHAIYGGRGCSDKGRVVAELGWSEAVRSRVDVSVVPGACHFPMLESPEAVSAILRGLLD